MSSSTTSAVILDPDHWLTAEQAEALERTLLTRPDPTWLGDLTRALQLAEPVCLNTALLGLVLGHESDGYTNKLYWNEYGPTAKNDAGWPTALWLPPASLAPDALELLRERTLRAEDQERAISWATWQLDAWWRFVACLDSEAVVLAITDGGEVVLGSDPAPVRRWASPLSTGELMLVDSYDVAEPTCAAEWEVTAVSERAGSVHSRNCVFRARYPVEYCAAHIAAGSR